MHLRPRNPPARPETETKKINTNKAKQFRRSHAEKESQPDRQTDRHPQFISIRFTKTLPQGRS
jgi:hypothetical protein